MDRIAKIEGEVVVSGQHPGLPNQQIPLWEKGSGVLFEDLAVKPAPGQASLFVPLDGLRVQGMRALYLVTAGVTSAGLIWGSPTKLFKGVTPPTTVDVTRLAGPYTGTFNHTWSIVQFGQAVFATNGKDEVQYLAPAAANFVNMSTVSDLPSTFRCRILMVLGAYLIAFNTDNDPTEFRWCDEDAPLVWTPAPANSARDLQMRQLLSPIAAVTEFGTALAAIGNTQAHVVDFIGPPFFFGHDHLLEGMACVSKHACTSFDRIMYGFGPDGIWESDGSGLRHISSPSIHKFVYEGDGAGSVFYDKNRGEETCCWSDADNAQIFWSYPTTDGLGRTISYDRRQGVWTMHDYWRTAATRGGPWLFPITGSVSGGVFGQGGGQGAVAGPLVPLSVDERHVLQTGFGFASFGGLGFGGILEL